MGAKKTPEIIPLCHPLPLGKITVARLDHRVDRPDVEGRTNDCRS
jgi:cyclic pyranopterin phosphate synthase